MWLLSKKMLFLMITKKGGLMTAFFPLKSIFDDYGDFESVI